LLIDNVAPDGSFKYTTNVVIIPAQGSTGLALPAYSRGLLKPKDRMEAIIDFVAHYGHPDGPSTRTTTRAVGFEATLKAPFAPPGFNVDNLVGPIPLIFGPREIEKDEPYLDVR
jgi:hypothetical protein